MNFTCHADLSYQPEGAPSIERRKLDLYRPDREGYPLFVWFHGGGLERRSKEEHRAFGEAMAARGIGVAIANYRLSPGVTFPAYVEDAAAAVAWTKRRAATLGADPARIFVGGHSAGGYLAALLAMDSRYLESAGLAPTDIAGYIPISGQVMTHFTIRVERGLKRDNIIADEAAPIFHTRAETQPMLMIVGDNDFPTRLEENAFFVASMKAAGNRNTSMEVIPDRDHSSIFNRMLEPGDPAAALIEAFICRVNA